MTLQDWCKIGWVVAHQANRDEIRDLLAVADRDIADCQTPGLSADWRTVMDWMRVNHPEWT